MKKFVIFTLIGAMAAGAVFAADGVSVNAWGRGVFAPLIVRGAPQDGDGKVKKDNYGDDVKAMAFTGAGATWGGNQVRVDFRIVGNAEFIGFGVNLKGEALANGDFGGNEDTAYIWAKPFSNDFLKIKLGLFVEDELRGKIGSANNSFDNYVLPGASDEDHIFTRFGVGADWNSMYQAGGKKGALPEAGTPDISAGFLLSSQPIDPLFIGIAAKGGNAGADAWPSWAGSQSMTAYDAWNYFQAGLGFKIDGIGHVRAQWVGGYFGTFDADKWEKIELNGGNYTKDNPARIEAAFALTAVEGLLVDLGGKFWLPITEDKGDKATTTKDSKGVDIGLGATFRMEAFSIGFRFDGGLAAYSRTGDKDESLDGASLDFRLNPAYDLEVATVGLLFGLQTTTAAKGADGKGPDDYKAPIQLGFGGYAQKGLGKGSIKAGLTFTTATIVDGKAVADESTYFSIPIILEYAFF
jgi:hypothetical protein